MDKIKVVINEDGITAKEVNPFGEEPRIIKGGTMSPTIYYHKALEAWQKAESSLRTFEIVRQPTGTFDIWGKKYEPGTIHEAEILENGRIKIID